MNEMLIDRVPPQNVDAERTVLGSMMDAEHSAEVIRQVKPILGDTGWMFYREAHQKIYEAIIGMQDVGVDLLTVTEVLEKNHNLEVVGGVPYLDEMIDGVPTYKNAEHYAKMVREKALLRRLIRKCSTMYSDAFDGNADSATLFTEFQDMEDMTADVPRQTVVYSLMDARETYKHYVDTIEEKRVWFHFKEIDEKTRGLVPGEVCFILARANVGKSALAQTLQFSIWNNQQIRSLFISLEMPMSALYERAASIATGFSEKEIEELFRKGETDQIYRLLEAVDGGMFYADRPALTIDAIRNIVHSTDNIGLILIDYLGLIRTKGSSAYERMSEAAQSCKELAMQTKKAVIVLAQVNRSGGDGTEKISFDMARNSGEIEEAADVVLGMHINPQDPDTRFLYVLKGRRGRKGGMTELMFLGDSPMLVPVEKREEVIASSFGYTGE